MVYNTTTYISANVQSPAEAYIAKNKNRLKQNGQNVYLNNKENFEIELFNPRSNSVKVKIKINGQYISNRGLVLRPGQRYWLERFIDDNRKFVYNTYEIDGSDAQAVAATAKNGLVEIEFYDEKVVQTVNLANNPWTLTTNNPTWIVGGTASCGNSYGSTITYTDHMKSQVTMDSLSDQITTNNAYYTNTLNMKASQESPNSILRSAAKSLSKQSIETGRVEKGAASNQSFGEVEMDFYSFTTNTVTWQIQPKSTEPVETKDLAAFCTECGKKQKQGWKFCPSCGTKVSA